MNGRPEPPEVEEKAADSGADLASALAGLTAAPEERQQLAGFHWM